LRVVEEAGKTFAEKLEGVLWGQKTQTPHLMRINLIIVMPHESTLEVPVADERPNESDKHLGIRKLINTGAEIAGGAIGGALGFLAAGPVGAAALGAGGAAAAAALKHIGEEASERLLGPREKVRVGGVLALAAAEVQQRVQQGESVRTDGFFDAPCNGRSDGEEVAESVLLKSQREAEERKLPYMAHLFASIAFDPTISAYMAHQLLKGAEQLTFRQLCLLRIGAIRGQLGLRVTDYRSQGTFDKELYQVLFECHDLYNRGFVAFGGTAGFGPTDVVPAQMSPQGIGADLHNTMKLALIPMDQLLPIAARLR
jgi:hypothetical protein